MRKTDIFIAICQGLVCAMALAFVIDFLMKDIPGIYYLHLIWMLPALSISILLGFAIAGIDAMSWLIKFLQRNLRK